MKILVTGVNGFIGSALARRILTTTKWILTGIDVACSSVAGLSNHPRFFFREGDIRKEREWLEEQVASCDVVVPLAAIARPAEYLSRTLDVFNIDFEENLWIIQVCSQYDKRIVFPSTSEVYGMCEDSSFNESKSSLVLGPIEKERWIYACAKQLLDRVLWAHGKSGLRFTVRGVCRIGQPSRTGTH